MSEQMKVSEKTKRELDKIRKKGETYSEIIDRLIVIRSRVLGMLTDLEYLLDFESWKRDELMKIAAAGIPPAVPAPPAHKKTGAKKV